MLVFLDRVKRFDYSLLGKTVDDLFRTLLVRGRGRGRQQGPGEVKLASYYGTPVASEPS